MHTRHRERASGLVDVRTFRLQSTPSLPSAMLAGIRALLPGHDGLGQAPENAPNAARPAQQPLDVSLSALVVEDNDINRLLLQTQLQRLGQRVETARNGVEALSLWSRGSFDIVVTDCNMPEMDGYDLSRAIRQAEVAQGRKRTQIIAVTGNARPDDVRRCLDAGMDATLSKPVTLADLVGVLGRMDLQVEV
jgi:two-component system sensor histidine kinase EvgS